jgi:phospholipase C
VYDHTSILRFIETRFDLPALTRRDANADAMLRLFRFNRASIPVPPTLPPAVIDMAQEAACASAPPPSP